MSTQRLRASDAEREQVAQVLRAAMAEGRLTLAEGEERLVAVYAASYRDELTPLVADLPGGGWQALRETPEAKGHYRRHVRERLGFAVVAAAILLGIWALTGAQAIWPLVLLAIVALGVAKRLPCQAYRRMHAGRAAAAPPWARH